MCYRLAPYREPRGKVNKKTRHISSLHFLVLFLACQTASPVKAKLHSHSTPCIPKYPHLSVCMCARSLYVCVAVCACACVRACVRVWRSEEPVLQQCRVAEADSRFRLLLSRLQLIMAITTDQQRCGHDTPPQQHYCFSSDTIMATPHWNHSYKCSYKVE